MRLLNKPDKLAIFFSAKLVQYQHLLQKNNIINNYSLLKYRHFISDKSSVIKQIYLLIGQYSRFSE